MKKPALFIISLLLSLPFSLFLDHKNVSADITSGLIGYWKYDEASGTTAADSSGSGNNGAVNGARWTAGNVNNALSFDGIDD